MTLYVIITLSIYAEFVMAHHFITMAHPFDWGCIRENRQTVLLSLHITGHGIAMF